MTHRVLGALASQSTHRPPAHVSTETADPAALDEGRVVAGQPTSVCLTAQTARSTIATMTADKDESRCADNHYGVLIVPSLLDDATWTGRSLVHMSLVVATRGGPGAP